MPNLSGLIKQLCHYILLTRDSQKLAHHDSKSQYKFAIPFPRMQVKGGGKEILKTLDSIDENCTLQCTKCCSLKVLHNILSSARWCNFVTS